MTERPGFESWTDALWFCAFTALYTLGCAAAIWAVFAVARWAMGVEP